MEHYLLGTPMRECTTKDIYKHGALRKVSSSTTPLVNVMLVNIVCLRNYNLCTTKDIYKHGALRKVSSSTTPLVNVMLVNIVCLRNYNLLL